MSVYRKDTELSDIAWLLSADRHLPPADELFRLAARLADRGNLAWAATACDAAYSLAPTDPDIAAGRARVLDRLEVREDGMVFRYVPAGPFQMGSSDGDEDERPIHTVELDDFWITDIPVSWGAFTAAMGWSAPPEGMPSTPEKPDGQERDNHFRLYVANRIRGMYCADDPLEETEEIKKLIEQYVEQSGLDRKIVRSMFSPGTWREKPMVAVSLDLINALSEQLIDADYEYRLPTEAEWEKAARGGLVGCRYPWGNEPPTAATCDFDRFEEFSIRNARACPPNGYGLYAMSGGVREVTADGYDALYYRESPLRSPLSPPNHEHRVVRGGSWADCAAAVTVSFRTSLHERFSNDPTIGFRLCRVRRTD